MTQTEALKLALEALVYAFYEDSEYDETCAEIVLKAKTAIKAALAQPTSAEYAMGYAEGFNDGCKLKPKQEREWVGLDEEEFIYFCAWCDSGTLIEIEKLLESKNT